MKSQRRLSSQLCFKEPLPYPLTPYYGETDRHLRVKAGEHIGLSPLTFKKCKPSKKSAVRDPQLFYDNEPCFEEFSVLAKASSKDSSEFMESFLIKSDTPNLNRNTASVELLLFDSR